MNYFLKPAPETSKWFTNGRTDSEKAQANKVQQKKYRLDPVYADYLRGLVDLRRAILNPKPSIALEMEILELTGGFRDDLLKSLGLENEYVRNGFLKGAYEIDHILQLSFFKAHPEFSDLMHRSYNLRVLDKQANRSRKKAGGYDNDAKLVICRMIQELIDCAGVSV